MNKKKIIPVYFEDSEREIVTNAAKNEYRSVSSFIRSKTMNAIKN